MSPPIFLCLRAMGLGAGLMYLSDPAREEKNEGDGDPISLHFPG